MILSLEIRKLLLRRVAARDTANLMVACEVAGMPETSLFLEEGYFPK